MDALHIRGPCNTLAHTATVSNFDVFLDSQLLTNLDHNFLELGVCFNSFAVIDGSVLTAVELIDGQDSRDDALRNYFEPSIVNDYHVQYMQVRYFQVIQSFDVDQVSVDGRR